MKSFLLALAALSLTGLLSAHECWLQPSTFAPGTGGRVRLTLQVGMEFKGEPRAFNPARVAALKHCSAAGTEDWTAQVTTALELPVTLATPGTHVLAYDSKPSFIELDAEKFREYLVEEGLDSILAERERAGEAGKPGRERYQRCIKSILQAGGKSDGSFATVTGQRLEIIPLDDPATIRPGGMMYFRVLLAGQPLGGAEVRAWHRQGDKLTVLHARTAANGELSFALFQAGEWMISIVHMARVTNDPAADWESHWGNLTFAIGS